MKRHTPEQIIRKLQKADELRASGMTVPDVCRQLEVSVATYHQWRKKYRGMDIDQARELKRLERENAELKKIVADLTLDNRVLKAVNEGKL